MIGRYLTISHGTRALARAGCAGSLTFLLVLAGVLGGGFALLALAGSSTRDGLQLLIGLTLTAVIGTCCAVIVGVLFWIVGRWGRP